MRYFKEIEPEGRLLCIGIGRGGVEITELEYAALSKEIEEKEKLVEALYSGTITLEGVPSEWREEIQQRVDEMVEQMGAYDTQDIYDEEALDIILGVSE